MHFASLRKIAAFLLIGCMLLLAVPAYAAATPEEDLQNANRSVEQALQTARSSDFQAAGKHFDSFSASWIEFEDGIKTKSKAAYLAIEQAMGEVTFSLSQQPVKSDNLIKSLENLEHVNEQFISGNLDTFGAAPSSGAKGAATLGSLVELLEDTLHKLESGDTKAALAGIETFNKSWLDVEGVVLTQSAKAYGDAERDMVAAKALLASEPPRVDDAKLTIQSMHDYLAPLAGKSSYTMADVITILLREGIEAILVIVALIAYLNRTGNDGKKAWIWYGVGAGVLLSVVLGVIVKFVFASGAFGSNNFLIAGWTGLFAAVMLLYMSYWLHSKSKIKEWQKYIQGQTVKALATGSLTSLALLSFLAVFREGTETVLFFIGIAPSISGAQLGGGIALGLLVLAAISFLIFKAGLRIPIRPFFLVSSLLVFYLCFKFTGMGINGLQLAGILPATHAGMIPGVDWLGLYPTWESVIPQALLLIGAITAVLWNKVRKPADTQASTV